MFYKTCLGLLCAGTLMAAPVFATAPQALKAGTTIDIKLQPNEKQTFQNPAFWPVEGSCVVSTEDESDDLFAFMKSRSGSVNGTPLKKGESITVTVHDGETFRLKAEAGAEVEVTNLGNSVVKGHCTAR